MTPYSALIAWDPPAVPNGLILNYTVVVVNTDVSLTVGGSETEANVTRLFPFITYLFTVVACNSAGCVTSPAVESTTDEARKPVLILHAVPILDVPCLGTCTHIGGLNECSETDLRH